MPGIPAARWKKTLTASPSPRAPGPSSPRCFSCPAWATQRAAIGSAMAAGSTTPPWPSCRPNPSPSARGSPKAISTTSNPKPFTSAPPLAILQPNPFTVGLGFTQGYLDDFEPEAFDLPLDAILNDNGVVWPI